jgi:hypothetical protein
MAISRRAEARKCPKICHCRARGSSSITTCLSGKRNCRLILRELIGSKDKTEVVGQVFGELVDKVGATADNSLQATVPDFGKFLHRTVADGMCMMIFGFRQPEELVDEMLEHIEYIGAKAFDYMMLVRVPCYKLFSFERVLKFESSCKRMLKIIDAIVLKRSPKSCRGKGWTPSPPIHT